MSDEDDTIEEMQRSEGSAKLEQEKPGVQLTGTLSQGAQDLHARADSIASKVAKHIAMSNSHCHPVPPLLLPLTALLSLWFAAPPIYRAAVHFWLALMSAVSCVVKVK